MNRHTIKCVICTAVTLQITACTSIGTLVGHRDFPDDGLREPEYMVRHVKDAGMMTSDGIRLSSEIYLPRGLDHAPTILVRLPLPLWWKNQVRLNVIGSAWASRGYAIVIQGTRGTFNSGGKLYPLLPERRDGIETLRWISEKPWFDGRLGMWGGSAFGHTQWVLWDQHSPRVGAFAVQIASTNFHEMFYPGGAFSLESALYWAVRNSQRREYTPTYESLLPGFEGFPIIEADDRAVRDIDFYNDWASHRESDAYWHEIDGNHRARELEAPVHMLAGWFDAFLPTQLEDFIEIQKSENPDVALKSRLVIGPWGHANNVSLPGDSRAPDYRQASLDLVIPWFDEHLRGDDVAATSPVRLFVMGVNEWRNEDSWPLERAVNTPFYLSGGGRERSGNGGGRLLTTAPISPVKADAYTYDPMSPVPSAGGSMLGSRSGVDLQNEIEARSDVLIYTTEPLDFDTEITGPVSLVLFVSTTAQSTDFTGKLVDVHPNGDAYNITDGILRRQYQLPEPGSDGMTGPIRIVIKLWPTSIVVHKGHRIRLEVSSSNYPRFDRNPNTGRNGPDEVSTIIAHQQVFHGKDTPSHLVLPLVTYGPRQDY